MNPNISTAFETLTGREILDMRTENVKHFDLGQGRRQAVIFASPVHFVNAKGAWEEIDNRLVEKTDAKGRRRFETKAGPFRARFFEDADGGSLASLSSGDTEFSWTYPGANISKPMHAKKALRRKFDSELSRRMKVTDRLSDDVTYESLFPGMSVRLTADDLGVKEDIILENKAALRHAVLQLPAEFDYVKNADESVSVLKNGEIRLTIDAPFTYDADKTSIPTAVTLSRAESGVLLRYEINESDLENAAFPVTIDPRVSFSGTHSNIQTAQICNRNKAENFSTTRYPASGTSTTSPAYTYMTLIKFGELMNKKASDTILSAELNVKVSGSQGLTGNLNAVEYVGAYEIKAPWEVNSVTWNSVDADNHTILDDNLISFISSTNVTYAKFDITDLYNKWYLPGDDGSSRSFGVVLRKPVGIANQNYVTFYSHLVTGHEPFVVINYLSHAGVKDWWTYDSMSAGRAGSANIDLFNGNLVVHHADSSTIGSRMPVSVKHIYNSCQSLTDDFGCGLGWRTNFNQIVRQETVANDTYYVWQDGEGTDHFFKVTTSQPYSDCEGMQLKMNLTETGLTITDKGDTVMAFEKIGAEDFPCRLKSITDPHGNVMTVSYDDDGHILSVSDGVGRNTSFNYIMGLLYGLDAPGCPSIEFSYEQTANGYNLKKIYYSDLPSDTNSADYKFTEYTYEGSMLTSMKNFDGCELALSYEEVCAANIGNDYVLQTRRVKDIEYKNGDIKGAKKVFTYGHMRTDVTNMENDTDGKKITYHFNSSGNVVDVNDEMWYTGGTKYDSGIENAPSDQGRIRRAVINRLVNTDFSSGWTQTKEYASDTYTVDTSARCQSMPSAKVVKNGAGEFKSVSQAKLFAGGKHTFSAYVKTSGLTVADGKKGAFLRVTIGEDVYESEGIKDDTSAREINTFANGWERVYVTFPVTREEGMGETEASAASVALVCDASSGTAYFSAPQVESGEIANICNLLVNGDFSATMANTACSAGTRLFPENWTTLGEGLSDSKVLTLKTGVVTDRNENHIPEHVEGNALRLHSFISVSNIYMAQTIAARGEANDVFVLGGWVNSHSVQKGYTVSKPAIRIRYQKTSDSTWTNWNYLYFTTENNSWHHMTGTFAAPYAYKQIQVSVNYPQNTETCMFSNIYLYRDLYGSSFTYDDNGNVVNVKDLSNQQSQASYDDYNNLLSYIQPGSASTEKYAFTYGNTEAQKKRHLPLTSTTPMGVKSATTYDQYGNSTANVVQPSANGLFMRTETGYTNNGNYVVSRKDVRGNVATNTVDNNGKVTAVTDPAGLTVNYVYDASNRVTDTYSTVGNKTYKRKFTYENDRKKTISHNTTGDECDVTYTYLYDSLGRSIGVKVGNSDTPLSTNVFENNRRGLLLQTDFANGGKVRYAYDAFGRVNGIAFDGNDPDIDPQYEVLYDARGNASIVRDNVLGTETRVVSDLADRISESVTTDANGNLLHKTQMTYDGKNRVSAYTDQIPGEMHKTAFTYDADNRLTQVRFDDSESTKVVNTYDLLNRLTAKTVTNGVPYTTEFDYFPGDTVSYGSAATTALVREITQGDEGSPMDFIYTYDNRGNIVSETRNSVTVSYEYDALNQLVRVNDPNDPTGGENGTTWLYTYDRGGNMKERIAYQYSTAEQPPNFIQMWINQYDPAWKDKLIDSNGITVDYDANGNPTEYWGWNYTWEKGRQLKRAHYVYGAPVTLEFKYNKSGLRTQKVKKVRDVVTETTDYIMSNKTLISMKKGNDMLYFSYDMSGSSPVMVTYNGARYTYVKNLLGDIVALADANGTIVCEYRYDAWGKPLSVTGTMAQTIGALNPFRYRGYIWDEDMENYYLRSRYYNPSLCRFLQADALLTMNAFAYANNNPIKRIDVDGMSSTSAETVDVVIYFHVGYNKYGLLSGSHYSMSIGDIWISFGPSEDNEQKGGRITICSLDEVVFFDGYDLPSTQVVYHDVPFEYALNGLNRVLRSFTKGYVNLFDSCSNISEAENAIMNSAYHGVNYGLNESNTYDVYWRPCISLIYEVCQDFMFINVDKTIGSFYKGDLFDPDRSDSNFLRAYEFIWHRGIDLWKRTEFGRDDYAMHFSHNP